MRIEISYITSLMSSDDHIEFDIDSSEKQNVMITSGNRKEEAEPKAVTDIVNRILELNYQKILHEEMAGLEGESLEIKIENNADCIQVDLWCPSVKRYEESGCTEKAKLLVLIKELLKTAPALGFYIRTSFD